MKNIKVKSYNLDISLPIIIEECTTDFFLKFSSLSEKTELEIIAGLTGLSLLQVEKLNQVNLDDEIFSALTWWSKIGELNNYEVPKYIQIEGISYKVPKDLRSKTLGQKLEIKQMIQEINGDDKSTFFDYIKPCFAVYFAPILGKDKEEVEKLTGGLKIIDVYPVANFFLSKYLR